MAPRKWQTLAFLPLSSWSLKLNTTVKSTKKNIPATQLLYIPKISGCRQVPAHADATNAHGSWLECPSGVCCAGSQLCAADFCCFASPRGRQLVPFLGENFLWCYVFFGGCCWVFSCVLLFFFGGLLLVFYGVLQVFRAIHSIALHLDGLVTSLRFFGQGSLVKPIERS